MSKVIFAVFDDGTILYCNKIMYAIIDEDQSR